MKRWRLVDANGGETGLSVFPLRGGGRLAVVGDEGDLEFVFVADMVVQERKCKRHCVSMRDVNRVIWLLLAYIILRFKASCSSLFPSLHDAHELPTSPIAASRTRKGKGVIAKSTKRVGLHTACLGGKWNRST